VGQVILLYYRSYRLRVEVVSFKVDRTIKKRLARIRDLNWSEVLRDAVERRLDLEERLRAPVDRRRALDAARRMDEFRAHAGPTESHSTKEIRRWRDPSRRS